MRIAVGGVHTEGVTEWSHVTDPVRNRAKSADGTSIEYWTSGIGPPLVMVHGTSADHLSWERLRPHLEPAVTVHAVDRRGRMGSGDTLPYSIEREGEDVAAVVGATSAGAHSVVVFGHSFGGVGALLAGGMTDDIAGLVIYEPPLEPDAAILPSKVTSALRRLHDGDDREGLMRLFYSEVVGLSPDEVAFFASQPIWPARVEAARTIMREFDFELDVDAVLSRITAPVVFLLGTDSPEFVRLQTLRAMEAIPEARLVELPGEQHIAHYTDPEGLAGHILDFVRALRV